MSVCSFFTAAAKQRFAESFPTLLFYLPRLIALQAPAGVEFTSLRGDLLKVQCGIKTKQKDLIVLKIIKKQFPYLFPNEAV